LRDSTRMRLVQHSDTSRTARRPVVTVTTALDDLPEVLTIGEAAAVLRISRTAAFELTKLWRASGGTEGLPVIRLGRSLRVSRADLFRLLHVEPVPESLASEPVAR
jgi:hypothetical protein